MLDDVTFRSQVHLTKTPNVTFDAVMQLIEHFRAHALGSISRDFGDQDLLIKPVEGPSTFPAQFEMVHLVRGAKRTPWGRKPCHVTSLSILTCSTR